MSSKDYLQKIIEMNKKIKMHNRLDSNILKKLYNEQLMISDNMRKSNITISKTIIPYMKDNVSDLFYHVPELIKII